MIDYNIYIPNRSYFSTQRMCSAKIIFGDVDYSIVRYRRFLIINILEHVILSMFDIFQIIWTTDDTYTCILRHGKGVAYQLPMYLLSLCLIRWVLVFNHI